MKKCGGKNSLFWEKHRYVHSTICTSSRKTAGLYILIHVNQRGKFILSCPIQAEAIQNILAMVDCAIPCGTCFPESTLREMSVKTLRSSTRFRWSPKYLSNAYQSCLEIFILISVGVTSYNSWLSLKKFRNQQSYQGCWIFSVRK